MENIYALSDYLISHKIGEKFRYLRLRQNITQQQLAVDSQLSLSTIKKVEKGEIASFDSFIRILRTLGCLDTLAPLLEEPSMSPSEYYEFTQKLNKKRRQRASKATGKTPNPSMPNKESEW